VWQFTADRLIRYIVFARATPLPAATFHIAFRKPRRRDEMGELTELFNGRGENERLKLARTRET